MGEWVRLQGKDLINSLPLLPWGPCWITYWLLQFACRSIASLRALLHYLLITAVCLQVHCFLQDLAALPTDYCSLPAGPLLPWGPCCITYWSLQFTCRSIASLRALLHYLLITAAYLQVHCFPEGLAALPTDYCSLPAGPLLHWGPCCITYWLLQFACRSTFYCFFTKCSRKGKEARGGCVDLYFPVLILYAHLLATTTKFVHLNKFHGYHSGENTIFPDNTE